MRNPKTLAALAAAGVAFSLAACGGGGDGGSTSSGGSTAAGDGKLVYAAVFANATMDPDLMPLRHMASYTAPAYDALTFLASGEKLEPQLATEWTAGSDETGPFLDMTLRDGLTYADGTAFTSATVVANIARSQTLQGSTNAGILAGTTVEATDATHVRLRNPAGVRALPRLLSGAAGMMISDKAIADGADLTKTTYGIGPWTLETVEPNRVVYTKTADYWDPEAAKVDTLEIQYLADDAKINAIRSGGVDITIVPEKQVSTAEGAGYAIEKSLGAENYTFSFNSTMAPFDKPEVREAVNLSLDREAICQGVLDGACEPTGQFNGAGTAAYDKELGLKNFPYDLEKAKSLVASAGATGAKVEIVTVAGNTVFEQLATIFQAQLNAIGLDASVSPVAPPQVVGRFTQEKNVAIAFGATGNAFDPSETINRYIAPKGLYNPGGYDATAINALAAEGLKETDEAKRTEIYRELSGSLMPDGIIVPILTPETAYVLSPQVSGWQTPWAPSFPSFRGVSG